MNRRKTRIAVTAGSYLLVDTPTITALVDLLVDIVCSEPIT